MRTIKTLILHNVFKINVIPFTFTGIKDFSNWPTIPQVFINGEFVGGCDIVLQMHQNGELVEELKKVGITSALLSQEQEKSKSSQSEKSSKE